MRFFTLILKNIARRRFRATFTIVGVALAVGAVVALVGLANGLEGSLVTQFQQRGVDLLVVRAGVTDRLTSSLDETIEASLAAMPEVREVGPELLDIVSFEDLNLVGVTVYGWRPQSIEFQQLQLLAGRMLGPDDSKEVMLGTILARNLGKKVGDTLKVYPGAPFKVVGIFQSFSMYENGGMVVPLVELQKLTRRQGRVTLFDIALRNPGDRQAADRLIRRIGDLGKGLKAMTTDTYVSSNAQIQLGQGMAWFTSAVAVIIGTVGVLNTMVMTVLERTKEIGVLRALGCARSRVVQLILVESIVLSLIGALVGTLGAMLLCRALSGLPRVNGLVTGEISIGVILIGFMIAVLVGLVGGLYPAWRGAQLPPTTALHDE